MSITSYRPTTVVFFLNPHESDIQTASRSVHPFLQHDDRRGAACWVAAVSPLELPKCHRGRNNRLRPSEKSNRVEITAERKEEVMCRWCRLKPTEKIELAVGGDVLLACWLKTVCCVVRISDTSLEPAHWCWVAAVRAHQRLACRRPFPPEPVRRGRRPRCQCRPSSTHLRRLHRRRRLG